MSTLQVDIVRSDEPEKLVVVALSGEAGATNAAVLDAAVTRLCAMRPRILVIDLSGLTLMASLCMGCIVALRRGISSHGGSVRLAGATEMIDLTLRRAKLHVIFPMHATVAESIAAAAPVAT